MKFTNRNEANEFYRDILFDAEMTGSVHRVMNELGRRDLFFLLTRLLHRRDVNRDWLFERCQDVQQAPNKMLDLWAREHYKSTIITFGKSIQDILDSHSEDSYYWSQEVTIGIFSHTRPIAKAFLSQIMQEFESNELLQDVYPDVLWRNPRREASKWSLDSGIVVKRKSNPKEATVEAHGLVDGQPTSKHFLILNYDDVVTRESVTTGEQIKKVTDAWALSLNLGAHGGVQRYIGTRYHYNDTYKTMMERGTATPRIHKATEDGKPEGEPVFLDRLSLREKRRDMGPYIFACQMLQDPKADEVQGFKEEWFRYWHPERWGMFNRYLIVDPASEKKKESDYTVMAVIGLAEDENYYIIDGIRDRMNLTERGKWLFKLHRKYRPMATGYEKYGQQADIEYMEDRMEHENYRFEITPLGGQVPKNDRIKWMIPRFEQGRIWMPVNCIFVDYERKSQDFTHILREELKAFPVSEFDDTMDCCARIFDPGFTTAFPERTVDIPIGLGRNTDINRVETDYDLFPARKAS
jgi:predicted phage terminase large subunit-like protein